MAGINSDTSEDVFNASYIAPDYPSAVFETADLPSEYLSALTNSESVPTTPYFRTDRLTNNRHLSTGLKSKFATSVFRKTPAVIGSAARVANRENSSKPKSIVSSTKTEMPLPEPQLFAIAHTTALGLLSTVGSSSRSIIADYISQRMYCAPRLLDSVMQDQFST